MSKSAMKSQLYGFGMLTITVIVAIDHLSSQMLAAQIISGVLVMSLILAYTVTASESRGVR
jgi:hypothetical protein